MENKQRKIFFELKTIEWFRLMMILSFLIRQQTNFLMFCKFQGQKKINDWIQILMSFPGSFSQIFIWIFIFSYFGYLLNFSLISGKNSLENILEKIFYPIYLVFIGKHLHNFSSLKSQQSSELQIAYQIFLFSTTLLLEVLYLIKNNIFQIKSLTLKSNILHFNYLNQNYFNLQQIKFFLSIFLPILIDNNFVVCGCLFPFFVVKIILLKQSIIFGQPSSQYFAYCGQIYSIFSFLKILILTLLSQYQIFSQSLTYIALISSSIMIGFLVYMTVIRSNPKLFKIQEEKYIKVIEQKLNFLTLSKTQRQNSSYFYTCYKSKIFITNLILDRCFNNKNYDFSYEISYNLKYLLSQYLQFYYKKASSDKLNLIKIQRELKNQKDSEILSKFNSNKKIQINPIFYENLKKGSKKNQNNYSIIVQNQNSTQKDQANLNLQDAKQNWHNKEQLELSTKKTEKLQKVEKIMASQVNTYAQRQGFVLCMTQNIIKQRNTDEFIQQTLNCEKENTLINQNIIQSLWKILLIDEQQICNSQNISNSQKLSLKKYYFYNIISCMLKNNCLQKNIYKAFYLFIFMQNIKQNDSKGQNNYFNEQRSDLNANSQERNCFSNFLNQLKYLKSKISHNQLLGKIGRQLFFSAQQKYLKTPINSSALGQCINENLQFSLYEPSFNDFYESQTNIKLFKRKIQSYSIFSTKNCLYNYQVSKQNIQNKIQNYYCKLHSLKQQLFQIVQKCSKKQFVKDEFKIILMIYHYFIEKKSSNYESLQQNLFKRTYFATQRSEQKYNIELLSEKCISVCSGLMKKGKILAQNMPFKKTFHQKQKLGDVQNTISNKSFRRISPFQKKHPNNNIYSTIQVPFPIYSKLSDSQQIHHSINNLLLLPFQQKHYQLFDKKSDHDNIFEQMNLMCQGIAFHNDLQQRRQNQLFCSDFNQEKHFEVQNIKLFISYLSLEDIHLIIQFDKIKQLAFLEIQSQKIYSQKNSAQLISQNQTNQELVYRFVHKSITQNKSKFGEMSKLALADKIDTKQLEKTFKQIQTIRNKVYFKNKYRIRKQFLQIYQNHDQDQNSSIFSQQYSSQAQIQTKILSQSKDKTIKNNQKCINNVFIRNSLTFSQDQSMNEFISKMKNTIILRQSSNNICSIFLFIIILVILFFVSYFLSDNLDKQSKQFLNLRKITHTDFILNQVYSSTDLIIMEKVKNAALKQLISQQIKTKYINQIALSSNLVNKFLRQSQYQLSTLSQQNQKMFFDLSYQSFQIYNLTSNQHNQSFPAYYEPKNMSFYMSYLTQLQYYNQMIQYILINEKKDNQKIVLNFYQDAVNSLNDFFQNSLWHTNMHLYFSKFKEDKKFVNYFSKLILLITALLSIAAIFINFYWIKDKIFSFIILPLNVNQSFKVKHLKELQKMDFIATNLQFYFKSGFQGEKTQDQTTINTCFIKTSSTFDVKLNKFPITNDIQKCSFVNTNQKRVQQLLKSSRKDQEVAQQSKIQLRFFKSSKKQIILYLIISFCLLSLFYYASISRENIIRKLQIYQTGQQAFIKKLVYQFDIFKVLLTNEDLKSPNAAFHYQQSLRTSLYYNAFSFMQQIVGDDETLKNNLLILPLCDQYWKNTNWYHGCSDPNSLLRNSTFMSLSTSSIHMISLLQLNEFQGSLNKSSELQKTHVILKAYEQIWNLHKIGSDYLNICHELTNNFLQNYQFDQRYWIIAFSLIVLIVIVNILVYTKKFLIFQNQIFTMGRIQDLENASNQYQYYINKTFLLHQKNIDRFLQVNAIKF